MTLKKVSSRGAAHGEVSSFGMRFSSSIIEYTLNAGSGKEMCIKEVSTALSTLHRAELLREHEQVMQVMVMDSLVTHPGRNCWAATLLKGMEGLRLSEEKDDPTRRA